MVGSSNDRTQLAVLERTGLVALERTELAALARIGLVAGEQLQSELVVKLLQTDPAVAYSRQPGQKCC